MNRFLAAYLELARLKRWDGTLDYAADAQRERVISIRHAQRRLGGAANILRVAAWRRKGVSDRDIAEKLNIPEDALKYYSAAA